MRAYERLLRYVKVYTQSADGTGETPSTPCQLELARQLEGEMRELGLQEVRISPFGIVTGVLPATPGCEGAPPLGFIAHLDTAPAFSGKDVNPILHPGYDGASTFDAAAAPRVR